MKQESVSELRYLASEGSEDALLVLLERFSPLFQKYARKFEYEDTYAELQCQFIYLIKNFPSKANSWSDGQTIAYLAKSMHTAYIKLSKQNNFREKNLLEFNPEIMDQPHIENIDFPIYLQEAFTFLSTNQKEILVLHYIEGYSIQEIAQLYGKTRQAINKIKNQALIILRKQLNS